jgi:hypothetical protein
MKKDSGEYYEREREREQKPCQLWAAGKKLSLNFRAAFIDKNILPQPSIPVKQKSVKTPQNTHFFPNPPPKKEALPAKTGRAPSRVRFRGKSGGGPG